MGGDISQRDGVEAISHHNARPGRPEGKPGLASSRFSEGADRNLLLKQRSRFGGRKAVGKGVAMGFQEAICGSRAHREETGDDVLRSTAHAPILF